MMRGMGLAVILLLAMAAAAQGNPPQPQPLEPPATGAPHTEMVPEGASGVRDPLVEPKPLPASPLALLGGEVKRVDAVRNRLTLAPFGGGRTVELHFDERTRILADGRETTMLAIHRGDHVHAETQALDAQVFARTIRVSPRGGVAEVSGQVVEVLGGRLRLEDRRSRRELACDVTSATRIERGGQVVALSAVHTGALVELTYQPTSHGGQALAIRIDATPGDSYTFRGALTHIDLREGLLAVDNQSDGNNYELWFDPEQDSKVERLTVGASVTVAATFDGKRYRANSIALDLPGSDRR